MSLFYPEINWRVPGVFADGHASIPLGLSARVASAYRAACSEFSGYAASIWAAIDAKKLDIHVALTSAPADDGAVAVILSDPGATELFWGMDETFPEFTAQFRANPTNQRNLICDRVLRLAEAVGALPLWLPEFAGPRISVIEIPETLAAIERHIGVTLEFPNPFPREFGIATPRGIAAERALQAIFQAWRIHKIAARHGGKILEIGAGLGRTAYYARALGIANYTIVDLPMGLVVQAAFLGRVLGAEALAFPGDVALSNQIRILTPATLLSANERYDAVLNVDSMTEMSRDQAEAYAAFIAAHAKVFISINHERNPFRVNDLAALRGATTIRAPYWMRPGYVEELFIFC